MDTKLIRKLKYSYLHEKEIFPLPTPLIESLKLISEFFTSNLTNKLCLVYPSKDFAAQWITTPLVLSMINSDFLKYEYEIRQAYKNYKRGERLILNNKAVVEWAGIRENGVAFKTKGVKESSGAEITIKFSDVIMLHKAPANRKVLSSLKSVKEVLPVRNRTPTEKLLNIETYGNKAFIKNKICLVTKYKSFYDSLDNVALNSVKLEDYFPVGKIDENGTDDADSPLLLVNNLSNLALYLVANPINKIIIDGFSAIQDRGTDFSDIDVKNIPTILITDLSEIESYEAIGNYGFEFFNFTKENLKLDQPANLSPFHSFEEKLRKYISFNIVKEICHDAELEAVTQKIHSIEKDESNNNLTSLKISLVQLTNLVSRVAHIPTPDEIEVLKSKVKSIESLFLRSRMWLGDSHKAIEESISLLKSIIENLETQPSEKCTRLKTLMSSKQFDYIICSTEEEAKALSDSLPINTHRPLVITVADVNDKLLSSKSWKAILTGWVKSNNINRILSSFLISELTVLFYKFENKYYNSLQRRNKQNIENIKATINSKGIRLETDSVKRKGFSDLYSDDGVSETTSES